MFNLFFYLYNILFKRELTVCYTLLSCKVSGYVETRLTLDFLQLSVKVWFTFKFFPIMLMFVTYIHLSLMWQKIEKKNRHH